jgi:hypothetical protein
MSFKPVFVFANNERCTNAQAFATQTEAENSARARFNVWTMPEDWDTEPSEDAPNYRWDDSAGDVRL